MLRGSRRDKIEKGKGVQFWHNCIFICGHTTWSEEITRFGFHAKLSESSILKYYVLY